MFKTKFILSIITLVLFLAITSIIKNQSRILEKRISNLKSKIILKKRNYNETQLDFYYLTSPQQLEKRLNIIGFDHYQPISKSKIFSHFSDFIKIKNNLSNLEIPNDKKIQKK